MNISAPVSGLQAASLRLANSANNVANISSTSSVVRGQRVAEPYRPTDVVQSSIEPEGGVRASLVQREPSEIPVYAPNHAHADEEGIVSFPNVDLENEVVDQILASNSFLSNLRSLRAELDTQDSLLNIAA